MADLDTNTAILISIISASSAIIGGLIGAGTNYLIERQRSKNEVMKVQLDRETRALELRDQAHLKFLSISLDQMHEQGSTDGRFFHSALIDESVALILTYGSPNIRGLVASAYPFTSLESFAKVQGAVQGEMMVEKGGLDVYFDNKGKFEKSGD
jgi:hypothetical protein